MGSRRARVRVGLALAATALMWSVAPAALQWGVPAARAAVMDGVQSYGYDSDGDFNDILPPGANGLATLPQILAFEGEGTVPANAASQLSMYSSLTTAAPNITESQIGRYFTSSAFGVRPGQVARVQRPERGVTIDWDRLGVPHIDGTTRAALMFGIGWATASERLFLIDAMRHAGEGRLASFAGGANASMDETVWRDEPYTQADRVAQVRYIRDRLRGGRQVYDDAVAYVAGINAYIGEAERPVNQLTMLPGEYALLGIRPQPWTVEDLVSIASLVGGIFGDGGGEQLANAQLYEELVQRFGPRAGMSTFLSFDDPADPLAPSTVWHGRFPYQTVPSRITAAIARTLALPSLATLRDVDPIASGSLPASGGGVVTPLADAPLLANALRFPRSMSNALLVSARDSTNGHPLVVMGPQVGYFAPAILFDEDIHGPGISAAGAAFAGVNMYVELGHGPDYAWSATSSGQNIIDTFAVRLCSRQAGARVSIAADDYLLHGRCVAMQRLVDHESWRPNLSDATAAGSVTFATDRTAYGLVVARALVHGVPVAYTDLRSTYMHELDSAVGFSQFDDPGDMQTTRAFDRTASQVGYTFNWFYANDRQIAYFDSGRNPVRAAHTDPLFPSWDWAAWQGYRGGATLTPGNLVERDTPAAAHPQVAGQAFLTSWNNKQAAGYDDAATGQEFASVYRSQLLDAQIERYLRTGDHRLDLADLIDAMGNAGTQDLRGVEVLPYLLKVVGRPVGSPALSTAVSELTAWMRSGAHRINRLHPGATGEYQQGAAVQLMDAWWPLLVRAEFEPVLGQRLLGDVESEFTINDAPSSHVGSAFDVGFYGIVQEDLRAVLDHDRLVGGMRRVFCGGGSLPRCRAALRASLLAAAAEPASEVYPASSGCAAGDQMCADAIRFEAFGAITEPDIEWVNRPTFQQADTITGRIP